MSKSFWEIVNKVIRKADVILMMLDARSINETRNWEIESKVLANDKPLIYVITKSDLIQWMPRVKVKPYVFVSSKNRSGLRTLLRIVRESTKKKSITVGVLGYPNVGKSSLINALKGRKSAPTSNLTGHTKGLQMIRIATDIMLLDTPGVIPYKEHDKVKHALIGTIDYTKDEDPEYTIVEIMKRYPGRIEKYFGVRKIINKEKTLERITIQRNALKKGGVPDLDRMARKILQLIQSGKI